MLGCHASYPAASSTSRVCSFCVSAVHTHTHTQLPVAHERSALEGVPSGVPCCSYRPFPATYSRRVFLAVVPRTVDMSLRPGVRRSHVLEYSVVDFVYNKRLRLRGLQRTCRSRSSEHPCVNCVFFQGRRKCLNPIYEYFLRPIGNVDPQTIDECLAHLLGHKTGCTRQPLLAV
jgi:hypothetical protein